MSKAVRKDWDFSDAVFSSQSTKKCLENYYRDLSIRKASEEEDIHNNIDYYINDIPIQWRTQRFENIKGSINNYVPTLRYTRMNSHYNDRKDSEFMKIVRNKNKGLPYPKHHIWMIVDKDFNIKKIFIIDLEKFIDDF